MNRGARLRAAREDDAAAVLALWTEAYIDSPAGGRSRPYTEAEFEDASRRGKMLVAERGEEVVAVVVLYPPGERSGPAAAGGEAELTRLAVAERARGAGLGRALASRCGEEARAAGWRGVALWSRPGQVEAHRLYESLGYRRAPERDSTDEGGERLVFRLVLGGAPERTGTLRGDAERRRVDR